ncbi:putative AH/BAR domain superfamily protein [Helianthus annuus]|nr:putative AH/BAR domain superfamily protein [Helianthus annuus]
MQGDDISNDPSACKEILGGLGTLFETERARAAPRELRINQLSTMLVRSSIVANAILEDYKVLGRREEEAARLRAKAEELVKAARAGAEQLERDRAAFDKQKKTADWNEKFSNERKKWNESWAKQNDNLFRARQELTNAKAANAALGKEKAAAEVIAFKAQQAEARAVKALEEAKEAGARVAKAFEEVKERESRYSKALEEANAERTRLNQVVASLQAEVQTREVAVRDLTARVTVAEERANAAVEARDALTSSFNQLEADREWMRCHGIARIVQAIMDAPETASGLDLVKERARDAGFKASYSRCIGHINVMSKGGYTEERSGFRDVDTEALLKAAVASFYDTSLSCVEKLDECLETADYVDRLRMLYADVEEENHAGGGQDGAGTSGSK